MSRGTPIRTVRIPDAIWRPAIERAQREGRTLSELMQTIVARYARGEEVPPVDVSTHDAVEADSTDPDAAEESP